MNQSPSACAARIKMKREALFCLQSQMGEDPSESQVDRALTLQADLKHLEELDALVRAMPEKLIKIHEAWDEMDNAAQRMLTALPYQMTEAAARLEVARLAMRKAVSEFRP